MRWTYQVKGPAEHQELITSVLEGQSGQDGVYRVRTELDQGLASTRLLAVTQSGIWARPDRNPKSPMHKPANAPPTAAGSQGETTADSATLEGAGKDVAQPSDPEAAAQPAPGTPPSEKASPHLLGGEEWFREIALPAISPTETSSGTWETVRVPAGEYHALRVEQELPSGEKATVWLAPGVGIVRRAWERAGMVEELKSFRRPASKDDQDGVADTPKTQSHRDASDREGEVSGL